VERPDAMTQGFLNRGAEAYSTPRFVMLYRRWQKHGDVVFEDAASPVLADALANGSGLVECLVLPHAYRHSHPWLRSFVRWRKRLRRGNREGNAPPHALNPG